MKDRAIFAGYVAFGLAIAISLIFGATTPLSIGWYLHWLSVIVSGVWAGGPEICIAALIVFGWVLGYRHGKREQRDKDTEAQTEANLRANAPQLMTALLSDEIPESIKDNVIRGWLEQSDSIEARKLEERLKDPITRAPTRELLSRFLREHYAE